MTVCLTISPINGLVFHSAYLGGMNAVRYSDFLVHWEGLTWTPMKQSYSYMTARERTIIQGTQVPTYSLFLNIVEQAISALKAAFKTDISRPEVQARIGSRDEAIARGTPLGEFRTQLLLEALNC